jgi:hypothetical protein
MNKACFGMCAVLRVFLEGLLGGNGVLDPLRPIPNSGVKRYSGDDSWGVAPCENSSLPSLILKNKEVSNLR